MARYIALLRAINVGGRIVTMVELKKLFAQLKFTDIETFIASGNVIFSAKTAPAATLERKIAAHLFSKLGYAVETFVRRDDEMPGVAAHPAFPPKVRDGALSLHVGFLAVTPSAAAQKAIQALASEFDEFHFHGAHVYWLSRRKFSETTITMPRFERALGGSATFRSITTVQKLAAKYGPAAKGSTP